MTTFDHLMPGYRTFEPRRFAAHTPEKSAMPLAVRLMTQEVQRVVRVSMYALRRRIRR